MKAKDIARQYLRRIDTLYLLPITFFVSGALIVHQCTDFGIFRCLVIKEYWSYFIHHMSRSVGNVGNIVSFFFVIHRK